MIEITLIGNLTADVRLCTDAGEKRSGYVSVAVDRKDRNGNNIPDYLRLLLDDRLARSGVVNYLTKGKQVYVRGEERVYTHEGTGGKTYVNRDVRVKDLQLLGGKQDDSAQGKDDCPSPFEKTRGTIKKLLIDNKRDPLLIARDLLGDQKTEELLRRLDKDLQPLGGRQDASAQGKDDCPFDR